MNVHDDPLAVHGFKNTDEAIAYIWNNEILDEDTEGQRAPKSSELEQAINGEENILDTAEWGLDFRCSISFCLPPDEEADTSWDVTCEGGVLSFNGLQLHLLNDTSIEAQKEQEAEDVVSPLRMLLMAYIEKKLHIEPLTAQEAVVHVGREAGVTFYPKICDIITNVRIREDIGARVTDEGLPVSRAVEADWQDDWKRVQSPIGASKGFKPSTMQIIKYAEIDGEVVDIRDMHITKYDLVMQAMHDTFGNIDARGKAIIDCEALVTLIMAFPTDVRLSSDDLGAYLIGMPKGARGKTLEQWRIKSRKRVNNALALTRALYFLEEGCQGVEIAKAQAVKWHGEELVSYILGRSLYVRNMMQSPARGGSRQGHAVRLTGRLFRRHKGLSSSALDNRFVNIAEQVIVYSGGLVPIEGAKGLYGELLHPKHKDHWMEFDTAQWARLNGVKYDATKLGRNNSAHSRIYKRAVHLLQEQTKRSNELLLDTQNDYKSTIEFKKPSRGKVIAFRATDAFRRAHLQPRKESMQQLTLHDLLRILAEK